MSASIQNLLIKCTTVFCKIVGQLSATLCQSSENFNNWKYSKTNAQNSMSLQQHCNTSAKVVCHYSSTVTQLQK